MSTPACSKESIPAPISPRATGSAGSLSSVAHTHTCIRSIMHALIPSGPRKAVFEAHHSHAHIRGTCARRWHASRLQSIGRRMQSRMQSIGRTDASRMQSIGRSMQARMQSIGRSMQSRMQSIGRTDAISHAISRLHRSEVCHSAAGSIKPAGHIAVTREHEAA